MNPSCHRPAHRLSFLSTAKSGFTLDLRRCTNLQHITFIAICCQDKNTATRSLSELLLNLREHQLLSIRMVPFLCFDAQERDLLELKAWECLDRILYRPGGQARARGGILTFTLQSALSRCSKGKPLRSRYLGSTRLVFARGSQSDFPPHALYNHHGAAVAPLECTRGVFGQFHLISRLLTTQPKC